MLRLSYILLLLLGCFYHGTAARTVGVGMVSKAELGGTPISDMSGNTTFLDGTTWCVASTAGVGQLDQLQIALDWACGIGAADCEKLRPGRDCFEPNNLLSHASYAFNSFYQQNGNSDIACNFGGTAAITTRNPSYGSCTYPTSGPVTSSSPALYAATIVCTSGFLLLLLYL